jgi:hypothetical protein
MDELHKKGLVQAQVGAQLRDLIGLGVLAQQEHDRVAHILEQHECKKSNSHHDNDCLKKTPENKREHRLM